MHWKAGSVESARLSPAISGSALTHRITGFSVRFDWQLAGLPRMATQPDTYRRTPPSIHRLPLIPAGGGHSRTRAAELQIRPNAHRSRPAKMPDGELLFR